MIAVSVETDWGIEDYIFSVDRLQSFSFRDILDMLRRVDDIHSKIKFNKADLDELETRLNNLKILFKTRISALQDNEPRLFDKEELETSQIWSD